MKNCSRTPRLSQSSPTDAPLREALSLPEVVRRTELRPNAPHPSLPAMRGSLATFFGSFARAFAMYSARALVTFTFSPQCRPISSASSAGISTNGSGTSCTFMGLFFAQ